MTEDKSNTNHNPEITLRQFNAFANISGESESKISSEIKLLKYTIGQSLTEETILPAQVFILIKGECRLIGTEQGKLTTHAKLGPGSFIGLASLLRTEACEEVSASTEVIVAAIPDRIIIDAYNQEKSFREWCNQKIWLAELVFLAKLMQQKNALTKQINVQALLTEWAETAKLVQPNSSGKYLTKVEESSERNFYVASANTNRPLGSILTIDTLITKDETPFAARIISIPSQSDTSDDKGVKNSSEQSNDIENGPKVPQKSGLILGTDYQNTGITLRRAKGEVEEVLACFQMLTQQLKLPFRSDSIEKILRDFTRRGQSPSIQICGQLGASLGLHVVSAKLPAKMGTRLQTPCILWWKDQIVIARRSNQIGLSIASPRKGEIFIQTKDLEKEFPDSINILQMDRKTNTQEENFGPSWFWPSLRKYRKVLLQVFIASFVVQLFSLANPLLIQIIIDKVISQRSLDTLQILGVGLVVVTLLEGILTSLRTFLFAETTNRIDQRLGAEVIDHLLRLPLGYFDKRPVGELGTRIAELEKIRNFLTGTALTTILDAAFAVIYIAVMMLYSWLLTLIALAVVPIQILITYIGAPLFRRQFRKSAEENAKTQSLLVEVLTGIQTVKAQNVEVVSRWKWQELYSKYIARTFEKTITGTALSQSSKTLQQLSQLLVLWIGASLVLKGNLTLGQLIAFRIISGYVTQPLLRLSTIWQNIQELKVSFERLGDVINTPLESNEDDQAKIPLPPIKGKISFEAIDFSFSTNNELILKNINLEVSEGSFVGIAGQSGSGKSTLMKLLPRLYTPNQGRILIDDYDIDKVELYSLRRQIGIVPQDPLLFSGTVSENISLTNPEATSDEIVHSAELACAHEFIMQLPSGYSTQVGERGGALSGGQRQRIAIARTLLSKPKLLVMDEATSALDYEIERKLCNNLLDNLQDCTVFFITHRLSTIKRANRVVMMHQGTIVESGTHDSLMSARGRYYALYRQQEAG